MISLSVPPPSDSDSTIIADPHYLICHSANTAEFLYHYVSPSEVIQFDDYGTEWNHSLQHLQTPLFPSMPPIEVGTLYWPSDESRFSVAYLLVDDDDLVALRPILYDETGPIGIQLTIDESTTVSGDSEAAVSVLMYALPPRPLATCVNWTGSPITLSDGTAIAPGDPVANSLYLLTVVDERYFHWLVGADVVSNDAKDTSITWDDWYDLVRDALGILPADWAADTVNAAFLTPSNRYTARRQPLPMLLDAAAWQNGQRVCRHLSGLLDVQNYASATQQNNVDLALLKNGPTADASTGDYVPLAGGLFKDTDLNRSASIPESVVVVFGSGDRGTFSDTPYVKEVTLASLSLTEFDGVSGIEGCQKVIVADISAVFDATNSTPTNDADLIAYANATAKAYYLWQLGNPDQVISGIAPYDSNGLIDSIKWTYNTGMCCTRIQRRRWNDRSLGMFRKSTAEGYLSAWPPNVHVNFVQVHLASATSDSIPAALSPSTITADNVDWVWVGGILHLDDSMGNTEDVTVLSVDIAGLSFTANVTVTFTAAVTITGIQNAKNLSPAQVEFFYGDATTPDDGAYCWYKDANGNQPADESYHWCELIPNQVVGWRSTTIALAITAGKRGVTPASMAGIQPGSLLLIDADGNPVQETVTVLSTTATTFTAVFANDHGTDIQVVGYLDVYQDAIQDVADTDKQFVKIQLASTTTSGAITHGTAVVVTPGSMANIYVGTSLLIDTIASGVQETVVVTAVTGSTFTANFVNDHLISIPVNGVVNIATGLTPAIEATFVASSASPTLGATCWYRDANNTINTPAANTFRHVKLTSGTVGGMRVYEDASEPDATGVNRGMLNLDTIVVQQCGAGTKAVDRLQLNDQGELPGDRPTADSGTITYQTGIVYITSTADSGSEFQFQGSTVVALPLSGSTFFTDSIWAQAGFFAGASPTPHALGASDLAYSPLAPGNWAPVAPAIIQDALDRLAAAVTGLLGFPIP